MNPGRHHPIIGNCVDPMIPHSRHTLECRPIYFAQCILLFVFSTMIHDENNVGIGHQ